jgi:hypothetical protein
MRLFLVSAFLIFAVSAHAEDDSAKSRRLLHIAPAQLNALNDDGTWNGYLNVNASPCPEGPTIAINMGLTKVKSADDVYDQLASKLNTAEQEAERIEEHCKKDKN